MAPRAGSNRTPPPDFAEGHEPPGLSRSASASPGTSTRSRCSGTRPGAQPWTNRLFAERRAVDLPPAAAASSWRSPGRSSSLSVVIAAVLRDEFTVHATILVEPQSISKKLVETGEEQANVMNRLHLMTMQILSRSRLSKVIDELKLYREGVGGEDARGGHRHDARAHPRRAGAARDLDPELKRQHGDRGQHLPALLPRTRTRPSAPPSRTASRTTSSTSTSRNACSRRATPRTSSRASCQRLTGRLRELEAQIAQVKGQNAGSLPDDVVANQRQVGARLRLALAGVAAPRRGAERPGLLFAAGDRGARIGPRRSGVQTRSQVLSPNQRLQAAREPARRAARPRLHRPHPDVIATLGGDGAGARPHRARRRVRRLDKKAPTSVAEQQARNEAQRAALRVEGAQKEVAAARRRRSNKAQERLANTPRVAEQLDALEREYKSLGDSAQRLRQQATRGRRRGEHGAPPEGRAVPRARARLRAARRRRRRIAR